MSNEIKICPACNGEGILLEDQMLFDDDNDEFDDFHYTMDVTAIRMMSFSCFHQQHQK